MATSMRKAATRRSRSGAAASKAQQLTRLDLGGCCLGAKALKVLRTKLDWPNALRTLCLSDNPGLVGRQDPHGQVLKPDAHAAGWAGFCEVLGKSQIAELQLRRVGMGPKGLETLALLLPQPPFNAALTSLDISENFLFGSAPLHTQVPDGPRKQRPDQEQGGWRRLCAAPPSLPALVLVAALYDAGVCVCGTLRSCSSQGCLMLRLRARRWEHGRDGGRLAGLGGQLARPVGRYPLRGRALATALN